MSVSDKPGRTEAQSRHKAWDTVPTEAILAPKAATVPRAKADKTSEFLDEFFPYPRNRIASAITLI